MKLKLFVTLLLAVLSLGLVASGCEDKKKTEEKKDDKKTTEAPEGGEAGGEEAGGEEAGGEAAGGEEAGGEAAGGEAAGGEAAGGGMVDIPELGLKAEAPAGTQVSKMMDMQMLQGPGLVVSVEPATDDKPKTLEEAKAAADMYTPQNITEETLPDGWLMTFTNEGGAGTNYWVQSRREIGGKAYWCSTTASADDQMQNAIKTCKSLTAAQ